MADEDATPESEVVVVSIGDEQADDGPVVPKEELPKADSGASPEPPPPGLVDVGDGTSETIVLEDPPREAAARPDPPKDDGQPIVAEEPPKDDGQPIVAEEPPKDDGQPIVAEEPPKDDGQPIVAEEPPKDDGKPIVAEEPPKDDGVAIVDGEPPPGLVDVADGSSNTIGFKEEPPGLVDVADGSSNTIGFEEEPPGPVDVADGSSNTIGFEEADVAGTDAPTLPADLFDASPAYATGSGAVAAGGAAPVADTVPGDGYDGTAETGRPPAIEESEIPAPDPLAALEDADDAEGEDDPGFFEQVADTVGDLWDDASDAVT